MEYSQEITNAIDNDIMGVEDIYDFTGSDFEELLGNYYRFCRDNLDIQSQQEKISPNTILFNNSFEINAGAGVRKGVRNDYFFITINLGLFRSCVENYYNNAALRNYFEALYPNTIAKFDNPINILAFQICTEFTYYHELAHLFQFSEGPTDINIQERKDEKNDVFDRTKHILEMNADLFASIAVTSHIEEYIMRTFGDDVTEQNTIETFIFFGCCLLNYTLNFSEKPEELYFEEHTHPHSFLRQLSCLLNMANHVEQNKYFKDKGISLNGGQLFQTIVNVYKDLEANGIFGTNVTGVIDTKKDLSEQMATYIYSLLQFETTEYRNAMDVWNKSIPQQPGLNT